MINYIFKSLTKYTILAVIIITLKIYIRLANLHILQFIELKTKQKIGELFSKFNSQFTPYQMPVD